MAAVRGGVLFCKTWQPMVQSVRHSRRVNVQHPRPPHYDRALIEAVCKPIFPKSVEKLLPPSLICRKKEEEDIRKFRIDNPYERILARELLESFNECCKTGFVAIAHRNPFKAEEKFNMLVRFKRAGMYVKEDSRPVVLLALKGTKYETILQLFKVHQTMIFCREPKVDELLKVFKKTPQLILLAAIIEDKFVGMNLIEEYARLKDVAQARAELVSVLNSTAHSVVTGLNQHQTMLVCSLDQIIDIKKEEEETKLKGTTKTEDISSAQSEESPPTSSS